MTSSDQVACFLADPISENPGDKVTKDIDKNMQAAKSEHKGSKLPYFDSDDQQMQATKKIEDLYIVRSWPITVY